MMWCPFECGYQSADEYQVTLHIETTHSELETSPFAVVDDDESLSLALTLQDEEENASRLASGTPTRASRSLAPSLKGHSCIENESRKPHDSDTVYVECPQSGCNDYIHFLDLNDHLDIHASLDDISVYSTITKMTGSDSGYGTDHGPSFTTKRHETIHNPRSLTAQNSDKLEQESSLLRTISSSQQLSLPRKQAGLPSLTHGHHTRLGKAELGPYAYEKEMPQSLYRELKRGPLFKQVNRIAMNGQLVRESIVENEVSNLVPLLAQLSAVSNTVEQAYFCHPSVQHCHKMKYNSGFCGYLNIQMQVSYIQGAQAQGSDRFGDHIPGILDLQDMIEDAWERDINAFGRLETGGVRKTRKWIGTPEVTTIYESLGIDYKSNAFHSMDGQRAHHRLYDFVEDYFKEGQTTNATNVITNKAPIYFQQPGHSLTIVGLERHKDGVRNLLVFDPGFGPSEEIRSLLGKRNPVRHVRDRDVNKMMRVYRRNSACLRKYKSFEVVTLSQEPWPLPI